MLNAVNTANRSTSVPASSARPVKTVPITMVTAREASAPRDPTSDVT